MQNKTNDYLGDWEYVMIDNLEGKHSNFTKFIEDLTLSSKQLLLQPEKI